MATRSVLLAVLAGMLLPASAVPPRGLEVPSILRLLDALGLEPVLPKQRGGTLTLALPAPRSLDPALAERPEELLVAASLFQRLTALGPGGSPPATPALATSWSSDPGLRRWEFTLDPEARFADGTPVQAADVKAAWERLVRPGAIPRPSPHAWLLAPVAGWRELAEGRARDLAGVRAPDPHTLVVELAQPLADLPLLVAHPALAPVPRALAARDPAGFGRRPVGNGPFTLAAPYQPGSRVELARNPRYAGEPAYLDRVAILTVPDQQTAWLALQEGLVDASPVPFDQLAAAAELLGPPAGPDAPGLRQAAGGRVLTLGFNLSARPTSDPRVRLGASLAVDRRQLAAAFSGTAAPATGLTPGSTAACPPCAHDLARARALLAQAGRPALRLLVPGEPAMRRAGELVAADLRRAGVAVTVEPADPAGYLERVRDPGTQAFLWSQPAAYPSPDALLAPQLASGAPRNLTRTSLPELDRLLAEARATPGWQARAERYRQAEQAALEHLPLAPLVEVRPTLALATSLRGLDLTPGGWADLAEVSRK